MTMNRDPESWARVRPDAFLTGSIAQARNVIEMAVKDIAQLAAERDRAIADLVRWRSAFQSCTPGGSEFMTPEAVRDYMQSLKAEVVKANVDAAKLRKEERAGEVSGAAWSYSINYGPDGQENWANLTTPKGEHVANIRTHHARQIVAALNAALPFREEGLLAALHTEAEWRTIEDLRKNWHAFVDADPFDGSADFAERMETAGYCELVAVTDDALDDPFAAERGIERGGSMWLLTDAGRRLRANMDRRGVALWSEIKRRFTAPETPVGLDNFLREVGLR